MGVNYSEPRGDTGLGASSEKLISQHLYLCAKLRGDQMIAKLGRRWSSFFYQG